MLTHQEKENTAFELQENLRRLNYSKDRVAKESHIPLDLLDDILEMTSPNPSYVWQLRDYLEDMLLKEGKEVYPWSRLANHAANRWYSYQRPWREN
ncbi:DUF2316 family protein [Streptococcus sp. zg-JUN1979]|uniref:DUF2316 family protein n=1 Tax=Streptococcus sp. zg-JUN1979 TaxID=3391450 RepID=UPI0039A73F10